MPKLCIVFLGDKFIDKVEIIRQLIRLNFLRKKNKSTDIFHSITDVQTLYSQLMNS